MKKKIIILAAIVIASAELISFEGIQENKTTSGGGSPYEMNPPIATSISIQKLPVPLQDGSNLKMMVQFIFPDATIPSTLDIYTGNSATTKVTFRDDGTGPDLVASDGTYTAYLTENLNTLISTLQSRASTINSRSVNLLFSAHEGTELTSAITINVNAFNAGNVMTIPLPLFVGLDCADGIDKARSLFITDATVVEDGARTYNVVSATGNSTGLYTFGNMFKEMANDSVTSVSAKQLLKSWVQNWIVDVNVGGQTVTKRLDAIKYMIEPWLHAAGIAGAIDPSNWSNKWDSANETLLLKNAPFKLTAIVNRIDLRGNSGFSTVMKNTGETRFIFTLITPYALGGLNPVAGEPPAQDNDAFTNFDFHDWRGMNVIFEYGNLPSNICDTRSLAQQWLGLSTMSLGSTTYKDALENITNGIIHHNAVPGKPNGSAINRIRTNERIFYRIPGSDWKPADWEFRQFELDATTHLFKQVNLTNTPVLTVNDAYLYHGSNRGNLTSDPDVNTTGVTTDPHTFIDWAFSTPYVKASILRGNFIIPNMYGTSHFLAASAPVEAEWAHYFDFAWSESTTHYNDSICMDGIITDWPASYEQMRHQISINTCQGCHSGETKTLFTQVVPLSYGASNKYWATPVDSLVDSGIDSRFNIGNGGLTSLPYANSANYNTPPNHNNCYPKVSGFLTGRDFYGYGGPGHSAVTFFDDNTSDANDNNMNGLYYVNSPANFDPNIQISRFDTPKQIAYQYGYNDLQRRAQDMCTLINTSCGISVMNIGTVITKNPFPLGSH